METTSTRVTTTTSDTGVRRITVNALAIIGFVVLVFIGITLAIYAARYVPTTLSRMATANVFLSSFFVGSEPADLEVVPGETIEFPDEPTTPVVTATSTPVVTTPVVTTPIPTQGSETINVYPAGGTVAVTPYGKADLTIDITEVGYLTSASTASFVKSKTVPDGKRPAIKFTVRNTGTNVTGSWEFKAKLPTRSTYTFDSPKQRSLAPGEYVDYTLGFDKADDGTNDIIVTVDSGKDVSESSESNNVDSVEVTVLD